MSLKTKTVESMARVAIRFPRVFWFLFRTREWVARTWRDNQPGDRAWRGAALGLLIATIVVVIDGAYHGAFLPHPTWDRFGSVVRDLRDALLLGVGLVVLASVIARFPWRYRLALGACGAVLASQFPFSFDTTALIWGILAFSLAGAGLAAVSGRDKRDIPRVQRGFAVTGILFGVATVTFFLWVFGNSGMDPVDYRNAATEAEAEGDVSVTPLSLPDPSLPGDYEVRYLTYGSGEDIRRAEFGHSVDLIAPSVDGRPFLDEWTDREGEVRKRFWGFDRDELPLQGRVWYPAGEGPFPLVLIVHGNHSMYEYSDPGYEYLGELLASRGMIVVSVDENFINGRIRAENDARGWLLLEHLSLWRAWNDGIDPTLGDDDDELEDAPRGALSNPFAGRVDMGRIGIVGHSRGGEAVAVAAAFNTLPYYPDDATVPFDYDFNIAAVIAIAPVMGQYQPGGRYTDLVDVNYFVIHGANDGDVSSFNGAGQYEHVSFSGGPYRFKSAVYVMGANHGQFNQVWGALDNGLPFGRMLSTRSLMPEEDQRRIGKVYISAFLEAALRGEEGYLPLFADARVAKGWLPETAYLSEFDDARALRVATFDEDVDVTTSTIAGGSTFAENLTVWREQRVSMKSRNKETAGVYLGWEVEEEEDDEEAAGDHEEDAVDEDADAVPATPRYVIEMPDWFTVDSRSVLYFSLADANESSAMPEHLAPNNENDDPDNNTPDNPANNPHESNTPDDPHQNNNPAEPHEATDPSNDDEEEDEEEEEPREPIDFTVRLIDASGVAAELPLSRFSMVQPQLEVELRKAVFEEPERESEAVFQSFLFPLEWFSEVNPEFDAERPVRLEFVFDRTPSGVVILDTVGFRLPAEL